MKLLILSVKLSGITSVYFAMISLQEKLTNTEAENNVLRQQAMKARPDNMPLLNMHRKSVLSLSLSPSLPPSLSGPI